MHTQQAASSQRIDADMFVDYDDDDPTEDQRLAMALSDILESGPDASINDYSVCERIAGALGWELRIAGGTVFAVPVGDRYADEVIWSDDVPYVFGGRINYRLAAFGFTSWLGVYLMGNRTAARTVVAALQQVAA